MPIPSLHSEVMKRDRREYCHDPSSSFASSFGRMASSFQGHRPSMNMRNTSSSNGNEDYVSCVSSDRSCDSLPSFQDIKLCYIQSPADIYSESMKKMLDPIFPFDRTSIRSLLNPAVSESSSQSQNPIPVELPFHPRSALDSSAPFSATISPRSVPCHRTPTPTGHLLPIEVSDVGCQARRNNSNDAGSIRGSYEVHGTEDMEMNDARSEVAHTHVGQKRRALSPPFEDRACPFPGKPEAGRRRDLESRCSATARLPINTATTLYDHRSRGGIYPTSSISPSIIPASLIHSPRVSVCSKVSAHSRNISGTSPRNTQDWQKPSNTKLQVFHICKCCPKKPKNFGTAEELSAHESEKQFVCPLCSNRFKNKNEAERHQSSLHVRRQSWSCSALSEYQRAFHTSINRPGEADICGYCGDEFSRSGDGPITEVSSGGIVLQKTTETDQEERIRHLQEVHKFRECSRSKKFFRADHFRQHLKHSHAGTSGKWTNMLENACMLEEDPTPR